jgi:hypothetical protein
MAKRNPHALKPPLIHWLKAWLLVYVLMIRTGSAAASDTPVRAVFIDEATERDYGGFPLPRAVVAKSVQRLHDIGVKAVVVKLFLDLEKDSDGDSALSAALCGVPSVLEAASERGEARPNVLAKKFTVGGAYPDARLLVGGSRGLIPAEKFIRCAKDIGFVDLVDTSHAPILEEYDGDKVKSLYLCTLELMTGCKAEITATNVVWFGRRSLAVGPHWQHDVKLPPKDEMQYVSLKRLLTDDQTIPELVGSIVVLGYDGPKIHTLNTSIGNVRAHRYWWYTLHGLYGDLK